MSAGVNKVLLLGNLGSDPDLKTIPSGATVCELNLATNESWVDKEGKKQERTEWHRIKVWGSRGESCAKYLKKGRPVFVEGKIQTHSWEDKEGNKRYTTEIIARDVQFLGGGDGDSSSKRTQSDQPSGFGGNPDDDIPF